MNIKVPQKVRFSGVVLTLVAGIMLLAACSDDPTATPTARAAATPTARATATALPELPEIALRAISPLPKGSTAHQISLGVYNDIVQEKTGGKLSIADAAGPETVPAFEQFVTVQNGIYDVIMAPPTFHSQVTGVANVAAWVGDGLFDVLQACGLDQTIGRAYSDNGNVHYVGQILSGDSGRVYTNWPINSADFSGKVLRASTLQRAAVESLGGSTVQLPPGEIYGAMQNGVIDGVAVGGDWGFARDLGWGEVSDYAIDTVVDWGTTAVVVNQATWDELPPEYQQALVEAIDGAAVAARSRYDVDDADGRTKLEALGVEFVKLPPAEEAKLLEAFLVTNLKAMLEAEPRYADGLAQGVVCSWQRNGLDLSLD